MAQIIHKAIMAGKRYNPGKHEGEAGSTHSKSSGQTLCYDSFDRCSNGRILTLPHLTYTYTRTLTRLQHTHILPGALLTDMQGVRGVNRWKRP